MSIFKKIHKVGAELFHADRQTDRHGEANRRFSQFLPKAPKHAEFSEKYRQMPFIYSIRIVDACTEQTCRYVRRKTNFVKWGGRCQDHRQQEILSVNGCM